MDHTKALFFGPAEQNPGPALPRFGPGPGDDEAGNALKWRVCGTAGPMAQDFSGKTVRL